jgi:hypothetical protein
MKDALENGNRKALQNEDFLQNCTVLMKTCLEENNISVYLMAVEVGTIFFQKVLFTEVVLGAL